MAASDPSLFARLSGEALALCYRAAPGYEARLRANEALVLSGEPYADLNYAVIDAGPNVQDVLGEFAAAAAARDLPLIVLLTSAAAHRLALDTEAVGLAKAGSFSLMTRDVSAPERSSVAYTCRQVSTDAELRMANGLLSRASGIPHDAIDRAFGPMFLSGPGLGMFLAFRGDQPICTVQTSRAGDYVGVWAMVTSPELQRQGAGRALLDHVIGYHIEQGAGCFYLGSTEAGRRLYESAGFVAIDEWTVLVSGESSQAESSTHD